MTSRQKRQSKFINSWKAAKRELTRVSSLSSCHEQDEDNSITDSVQIQPLKDMYKVVL